MPYPGEVLGGMYRIEGEIGAGGGGIIYRAWHLNLCKYVVVKKIRDHFVGVLNERGEVDILKSLRHTCLPQVYDFLCIGGSVYTVMDYIDGYDLKHYIDWGTRFDTATLFRWLMQLTDVLRYLHAHGILHLDIKPANIMVTTEGNICLIDFNVSFSGSEDELKGLSVTYASPEQCRSFQARLNGRPEQAERLDARTDLYSLGATFYHVMTGYPPRPYPEETLPLTRFDLPYPDALVRIVAQAMRQDWKKRYQSADQMYRALEDLTKTKAEKNTLKVVFGGMLAGIVMIMIVCGILVYRNTHAEPSVEQTALEEAEAEKVLLTAELLVSEENYAQALELYEELGATDADTLSRMGYLAVKLAESDASYAEKAVEYYEAVRAQNAADYTDLMNLVTAYADCGRDGDAITLLREMMEDYPSSSAVAARLAVLEYNAEIAKPAAQRDFTLAREHAETAKKLYEAGDTDCDIEQVEELIGLMN